jgi:hypothetical protein
MTYADVVRKLGWPKRVCLGGCSITVRSHRAGFIDPFNVLHWQERRVTRRGLRKFFLLLARRNREADPTYLNERRFAWLYLYLDEQYANALGQVLGVRFPIEFSRTERWKCLRLAHKANARITKTNPRAYSWASRGI